MGWSELPAELLEMISCRLPTVRDYIQFRAVCVTWRSATAVSAPRHFPSELPWLLMPTLEPSDWCDCFSLSHNRIHRLHLPELREKRVCGSSHGWLAAVDTASQTTISLVNPLTRAQIHLPPLNAAAGQSYRGNKKSARKTVWGRSITTISRMVNKVVLSSNPTSPDGCVAVAISTCTPELRIFRIGEDESWTLLDWNLTSVCHLRYSYEDVVFFEEKLFAVDNAGKIIVYDVDPTNPGAMFKTTGEYLYNCPEFPGYLVALSGKLLFVDTCRRQSMEEMEVFEVDSSGDQWVEMQSLGGGVLFVGKNTAFSLLARDFLPGGGGGMKGNCVFFADGICGVYDLEDGTLKQLPCYDPVLRSTWSNPIWFIPTLC